MNITLIVLKIKTEILLQQINTVIKSMKTEQELQKL